MGKVKKPLVSIYRSIYSLLATLSRTIGSFLRALVTIEDHLQVHFIFHSPFVTNWVNVPSICLYRILAIWSVNYSLVYIFLTKTII